MKPKRSLWVILFGIPALLVLPFAMAGSTLGVGDTIQMQVHEKNEADSLLGMTVPAAIVPIALHCMPEVVIDEVRMELDREAVDALNVARAMVRHMERVPDGVLVEVMDGADYVLVEKRAGKIVVEVDTPDETVRCSVPLRTVSQALGRIVTI